MKQANGSTPDNKISGLPLVAIAVICAMLVLVANILLHDSFSHGSGMDTFNAGAASPWQLFINMDLMAGLFLMTAWVIWRERGEAPLRTIAWVLLILWWGNIAAASFILTSFVLSAGRADVLLLGRRAGQPVSAGRAGRWVSALCLIGAAAAALIMIRGLVAVRFEGVSSVGYVGAFGTLAFSLAVFAMVSPRRAGTEPATRGPK